MHKGDFLWYLAANLLCLFDVMEGVEGLCVSGVFWHILWMLNQFGMWGVWSLAQHLVIIFELLLNSVSEYGPVT